MKNLHSIYFCIKIPSLKRICYIIGFTISVLVVFKDILWIEKFNFRSLRLLNDQIRPFFKKPIIANKLNCENYFTNNCSPQNTNRITFSTPENLSMKCEDILSRHYFPSKPFSNSEKNFPIAFAKTVYKDYFFLEMELANTYAPQNFYCFAIDSNATTIFKEQIHILSSCFPNVFYTKKEFALDSHGHFMNFAHFECINLLAKFQWKYVVLLQNHDFALKTNAEMVQIFQWLNGTNDVELRECPIERLNLNQDWSFAKLKLFKNATKNYISNNGFSPILELAKGYVEVSLSRGMIDFMIKELNLTEFFWRINNIHHGGDEIWIPTLQAAEALNIPGGFISRCIKEVGGNSHFTRFSNWEEDTCKSGLFRNKICIFGVEDLQRLTEIPHLFGNKMVPKIDFGAYVCWSEKMFKKTYGVLREKKSLNPDIYLNHPAVRFNKERKEKNLNINDFKCQ